MQPFWKGSNHMEHLDDARVLLYRGGRLPDGSWPRADMPDEEKVL